MTYVEDGSRRARRKDVCTFLVLALLLFLLPGNSRARGLTAKDFLGPVPGIAFVYESPDGFGPERLIGMGEEGPGIYRIVRETPLPPRVVPDPLNASRFLSKGYFQQWLFADERHIVLKRKDVNTVILDMTGDMWASPVFLQIPCSEKDASATKCPPPRVVRGLFEVVSKTTRSLLGEQRTVIAVRCEIRTKDHENKGSTIYTFVSGLGVFNGLLPDDIHVEQLTEKDLTALDGVIKDVRKAFGKSRSYPH